MDLEDKTEIPDKPEEIIKKFEVKTVSCQRCETSIFKLEEIADTTLVVCKQCELVNWAFSNKNYKVILK